MPKKTEPDPHADSELTPPVNPQPSDPPGWEIRLTEDGQWQPIDILGGETLLPQPTKVEAVASVSQRVAAAGD